MSNKIIIHIGANKTGSSSIQRFIQKNQEILTDEGFIIPDRNFEISEKITGEQVFALQEFITSEGRPGSRLKTKIDKIFNSSDKPNSTLLISAENMGTVQGARLFKEVCSTWDTKVIFYIRRQDDLIASSWQQWNSKTETDFDAFLIQAIRTLGHWETIIENWAGHVGQKNMLVEVFERSKFPKGNIIYDFINKIGCEKLTDEFDFEFADANLSYFDFITPLVAGNRGVFSTIHDNDFYRVVQKLTGTEYARGKKYSLMSRAQRENILRYFANQNERVRAKYFSKEKQLFSPVNHDKYEYVTKEEMTDLQLRFLTHLVFEIGKRIT